MTTLYDAMGGADAVLAVAHHWHERVLADPVVSHAFRHGFRDDHTERLAAYWAEVLGGPTTFSASMGTEADVVRRHSGNGPHAEMDRRAVECFARALEDAGVPDQHREALVSWFRGANEYVNHHFASPDDVPDGLPMPVVDGSAPVE
ncbi:oxidoreductase [Nocardioides halotolerans]|jgi:hemoglobin|uniref:globin domain-containing protein n=1 Tax=Nocardioides halotolerans TaxID=433660 RepID=UPI00040CF8C0|nr:oxidoreductase [Nocardioides halotolerans]